MDLSMLEMYRYKLRSDSANPGSFNVHIPKIVVNSLSWNSGDMLKYTCINGKLVVERDPNCKRKL